MPLVEYRCKKCSSEFEILVGVSQEDDKAVCPECGSRRIRKLFSSFSAKVATTAVSCGSECSEMGVCGTDSCPCAN